MTQLPSQVSNPRTGMLATVRNRRGVVAAVEPYDGHTGGRLHLVTVEYIDADGPAEDRLIWEREVGGTLLEPTALPDVHQAPPMPVADFEALVRASRWTAVSPFVDPDGSDGPLNRLPVVSPFHGTIQVEDFQLVPLLKALRMPRVSLLLADDVGLGKTVEAGLILSELVLRRRVRRVMILCPASLRSQWQEEMRSKFSISFDIIDRDATHLLRRQLGLDANPWRAFSRVITSYDYLKQPDVMEEFRSASRPLPNSPHLPWDLLIVDEAHNLAPASMGEDSDVSRALGFLAPLFEHKLFLTATPHNGHTRSFSGLLERLDPVRFSRKSEKLSPSERARVEEVVVRRLKREINQRPPGPRFCNRTPKAITLKLATAEKDLAIAFHHFRRKVRELIRERRKTEQLAGAFAVEILGKRLLSCPATFANSWHRYLAGLSAAEAADAADVKAAERSTREDTADDREVESRTALAASTVGAWLKPLATTLAPEMGKVSDALDRLGLGGDFDAAIPKADSRFDALMNWVDANLRSGEVWRADERLVVFTEYKTTLDYLQRRLTQKYGETGAIRVLYGNMDSPQERDALIAAFNAPDDPVRILVATDAASEGLNLQSTARYLLHYDVPWNPARLEQRNGRLDRHGQARDVTVFHFETDEEADLKFLSYVVKKVDQIREDLGATGEVFDEGFRRRLIDGEDAEQVRQDLDKAVEAVKGRADLPRDARSGVGRDTETGEDELARLNALAAELDLDPGTLRDTLDVALGIGVGRPRFEPPDDRGRVRLKQTGVLPEGWLRVINESLRIRSGGRGQLGTLPFIVFDPEHFIDSANGRPVFRPQHDTALLRLGHPMFQRALASFARARFPNASVDISRWTVRRTVVPDGADALFLLTVEELAVNELRESFHHWVRTLQIPIVRGGLGVPLPHVPAKALRADPSAATPRDIAMARDLWSEAEPDVRALIRGLTTDLTNRLKVVLQEEKIIALEREQERFKSRQGELSALMQQQNVNALRREIEDLTLAQQQRQLFDSEERSRELASNQRALEEEIRRRIAHYEELREQLTRERTRIIEHVLPGRYTLRGEAQVLPLAIEIRLPAEGH